MNKKILLIKFLSIILICMLCVPVSIKENEVNAFSNQVIQHGAVGDDVIELQSRLQYLGFYTGKIDGVFGWRTYWALRNFQYEFGLPIDGMAGWQTKNKLAKASNYNEQHVKEQIKKGGKFTHYGGVDLNKQKTPAKNEGGKGAPSQPAPETKKPPTTQDKAPQTEKQNPPAAGTNQPPATNQNNQPTQPTAANVPNGFSQNDIRLMSNAVYGESRGEPYIGQVAVAAVILNRVESSTFPNSVSGVIFEPRAFTAVADGQIWLTPNEQAKKAVVDAMNGWDPTGNAIYYFNPDTATSGWIWTRPQIKQIGKHIFCK